jgi:hypothetical protein
LGTYSAVVGRNGPFLCAEGVDSYFHANNDLILATFDTTPSPHGRINAPSLLLALAHIHGEAGTPTLATYSAVVGRSGPCLCLCRRRGGRLFPCQTTSFSLHSTPPRLRTGESMHLVYFWPSPTSMARRERQLWAPTVQWWVGTGRVFVCAEGVDYYFHANN